MTGGRWPGLTLSIGVVVVGLVESFAASYLSGMEVAGFHFGDIKDVTAFVIMILLLLPYCAALILDGASSTFIYYRF